jgi:hypothetical protein
VFYQERIYKIMLKKTATLFFAMLISAAAACAQVTAVGPDATTQGSWNGKYGQDGFAIANGPSSMPSYGTATVSGAATFTWAGLTTDVRALQSGAGLTTRMASTYYGNSFNVNVSVNDGASHPVSLYFLDWDTTSRAQTVTVMDASTNAVLDTEGITAFYGGKYFTWNVSGNVTFSISTAGGSNAVLGGIFFGLNSNAVTQTSGGGATSSATPIGADTTTQGSWKGKYGSEGYYVAAGASQDPSYGSAVVNGASTFTWTYKTTDPRALQNFDAIYGNIDTAATYYANSFDVNVSMNDGNSHQISLYLLDWDRTNLVETINVYDATTGGLLDSQTLSNFGNGTYFSWTVKGNVRFHLSSTGYNSALVSGIFFGAGGTISTTQATNSGSAKATWVGADTATQGTWTGTYGAAGYMIANGPSVSPSYADASVVSNLFNFTWAGLTTDPRALQLSSGSSDRIASMYGTYKVDPFEFHVTITDGNAHNVSLYLLDWDSFNRPETVSIIDPSSNQVLDSETFNGYHNGVWATWNIQGNVVIRVTPIGEIYAAASGLFFD